MAEKGQQGPASKLKASGKLSKRKISIDKVNLGSTKTTRAVRDKNFWSLFAKVWGRASFTAAAVSSRLCDNTNEWNSWQFI